MSLTEEKPQTQAERQEPEKFDGVLKRVKFLQGLGLSRDHAAGAAGSTARSVQQLEWASKKPNAKAKKKTRRS